MRSGSSCRAHRAFCLILITLAFITHASAQLYMSGVFRATVPGVDTKPALWVLDTDFFAANTGTIATMARNGYTLTDLAVDTSTGKRYYSALFKSGEPYTQYFELLPTDFANKVTALAKQKIFLISLHTLINPQDKHRYYSGIFQAGSGAQNFSGPSDMSYQNFKSYVDAQAQKGYFLASMATYFDDGQDRYTGSFRSGSTQDKTLYMFKGGTYSGDWDSIASQTLTNAAHGMRLSVLADDGQGHFTGAWIAGTDPFEVVAATTQDVFNNKLQSLKTAGLSPTGILMESDYEPPLGLAAAFHSRMDTVSAGGYSYAVVEKGALTAQGGNGYARMPWDPTTTPMSANTRQDIASMSKFIAAVAMYKAFELHPGLGPTTTLATIFGHSSGQYVDQVQISNLLNMNAGITEGSCGSGAGYYDNNAYLSCVLQNCTQPPDATSVGSKCTAPGPGIWSAYSNPDFGVLRAVIEHQTGQTFENFTDASIFRPLGINSAQYPSPTDIHNVNCHPDLTSPNLTLYYAANQTSGPGLYDQEYNGSSVITPTQSTDRSVSVCGVGGVQITTAQAAVFWNALMHGKIISQANVTALLNNWVINQSGAVEWSGQGYAKDGGYGVYNGQGVVTGVIVLPATDTQAVVFANTAGSTSTGAALDSQMAIQMGLNWMYYHPVDTVFVLTENAPNPGTGCLNVSGGNVLTNASIIQWGCNASAPDSNDLFVKVNSLTGDGTFMLQTSSSPWAEVPLCQGSSGPVNCNSYSQPVNVINTDYTLFAGTPLCITATTSGSTLSACNGLPGQMFKLTNTSTSGVSNIAVGTQCLGVDPKGNIVQQSCAANQPQLFQIKSATAR